MAIHNTKNSNYHIYSAIGQLADIMIEIVNIMPLDFEHVEKAKDIIERLEQIKENDERNIRGR